MELKRISELFWTVSPNIFFLSIILGVFTGISYAFLIPFILYAVSTRVDDRSAFLQIDYSYFSSPTAELASAFLWTCVLIVLIKAISLITSTYVANKAAVAHRLYMYQRIQHLTLADMERLGQARLLNVLNIDIPSIAGAAALLPQMWINVVTVVGILGYLVYVNAKIFVFVFACLVLAVLTYQLPLLFATGLFRRSRDIYDQVQQGVDGLIHGAKELKLNREKAEEFHRRELSEPEARALRDTTRARGVMIFLQSYGEIISFLIISVVVFHLRYLFAIDSRELMGLAMALLYLSGPVGGILSAMSGIRQGKVSLKKLASFYAQLAPASLAVSDQPIDPGWRRIRVRNLSYSYTGDLEQAALRCVDLEFTRGQISFIVGGNGSGKSTLGKCLSLLYIPSAGTILFDDTPVTSANIAACREQVSAIFPDHYLFKKLYFHPDARTRAAIPGYLKYLELEHKVEIVDDAFSTTELSHGQRKRLALLVMLLEDRDVCLFDEWAADQDPHYKDIFYSVVLRDLRERGKVVIVISHDDRYFHLADQLIFLEDGVVRRSGAAGTAPAGLFGFPGALPSRAGEAIS